MGQVRTEIRLEAREKTTAKILGHPDEEVACEIRDISKSGMCIFVDREIPLGRIMKVEWSDNFLVGRTQRVSASAMGFVVGLELLYCSRWNEPIACELSVAVGDAARP